MNSVTKMSVEGAVVIPLEVRERLHLEAGVEFDVSEKSGLVILKRRQPAKKAVKRQGIAKLDTSEVLARLPKYDGPPLTLADMEKAIDQEMQERWKRKLAT
jgi:AbrB family looped-hinge helix DNA binding protein